MARNTIKCIVTGAERITNNSYLGKKAEKAGVSVDCIREHYVSKPAVQEIKAKLAESGQTLQTVSEKLQMSAAKLENILILNGKVKPERMKELKVEPVDPAKPVVPHEETVEQS